MHFLQLLLLVGSAGFQVASASCDAAICDAYKLAYELEGTQITTPPAGVPAGPWCKEAQGIIVGVSAADADKLKIEPCTLVPFKDGPHKFEHQHTNFTKIGTQDLDVTCFSFLEPQDGALPDVISFAAKSIDCKMVDATRVAQQLGIKTDSTVQCLEVNKKAIEVAKKLLPSATVQKYEANGRPFCFKDDANGFIGPLWVSKQITLTETAKCLEVTSTKLISDIHSLIYPGNHYCKLLSPARAMDWIVTDSLKPYNPCDGCAETISV